MMAIKLLKAKQVRTLRTLGGLDESGRSLPLRGRVRQSFTSLTWCLCRASPTRSCGTTTKPCGSIRYVTFPLKFPPQIMILSFCSSNSSSVFLLIRSSLFVCLFPGALGVGLRRSLSLVFSLSTSVRVESRKSCCGRRKG